MSDSDGDLSTAADIPADAEIEECIRSVVREAVKKDEEVTVKLARRWAEERLGLEADFLKDNAQWKERSRDLINAAFQAPSSPEVPKKTAAAPKSKPAPKAGTKRKPDETQPSRKKQKKTEVSDSDADEDLDKGRDEPVGRADDEEVAIAAKPNQIQPKSEDESALSDPPEDDNEEQADTKQNGTGAVGDDERDLSSVIDDDPPPKKKRQKKTAPAKNSKTKAAKAGSTSKKKASAEDDESELSSVLDDPPPKKGRKKKSTSPTATSKPNAKSAGGKNLSPDEEEIKRLQSWLLKCGIRKLWHRELAPFDTSREKIKHLKDMLEEAGMTGRFSAEKAKQIKEARELKAELEAATEFNKTWGHDEGDGSEGDEEKKEEGDDAKEEGEKKVAGGGRARPKGYVDFGDSDEESE